MASLLSDALDWLTGDVGRWAITTAVAAVGVLLATLSYRRQRARDKREEARNKREEMQDRWPVSVRRGMTVPFDPSPSQYEDERCTINVSIANESSRPIFVKSVRFEDRPSGTYAELCPIDGVVKGTRLEHKQEAEFRFRTKDIGQRWTHFVVTHSLGSIALEQRPESVALWQDTFGEPPQNPLFEMFECGRPDGDDTADAERC